MVQNIERLCSELHTHGLAWLEALFQRHVEIDKLRPNYGISSQVAVGPGSLQRKGARIEEEVRSSKLCPGSNGYTAVRIRATRAGP